MKRLGGGSVGKTTLDPLNIRGGGDLPLTVVFLLDHVYTRIYSLSVLSVCPGVSSTMLSTMTTAFAGQASEHVNADYALLPTGGGFGTSVKTVCTATYYYTPPPPPPR